MTSAQLHRLGRFAQRGCAVSLLIASAVASGTLGGCNNPSPIQPETIVSPFARDGLWGVVPFANESGVSSVDSAKVADAFTAELEQVEGISTVPVNRVILAMRRLGLPTVSTQAEARAVMNALGLDGLVVGTVTAWNPYPPPTMGAAAQVFIRPDREVVAVGDTRNLTRSPSGERPPAEIDPAGSWVGGQASGMFDGSSHQTLAWLDAYAAGRTQPESSYGRDIYLVSMELYTRFVSYRLIRGLLDSSAARMSPIAQESSTR